MPQLDFLTFTLQISLIFYVSWSIFLLFSTLILPQYVSFNLFKLFFWNTLNWIILSVKLLLVLAFLHSLTYFSQVSSLLLNFLKNLKGLTKNLTKNFLRFYIYEYISPLYIHNHFSNTISFEDNVGQESKLNFLLIKNSIYSLVQHYLQKKLCLKNDYEYIMVKYTRKYRLAEDETIIHNLVKLEEQKKIFKLGSKINVN